MPDRWEFPDERRLSAFRTGPLEDPHTFTFLPVEALPAPTEAATAAGENFRIFGNRRYIGVSSETLSNAYMMVEQSGRDYRVFFVENRFSRRIPAHVMLDALSVEHLVAMAGGLLLHASYIAYKGRGILFTAPSGTGKSTQADLWCRLRGAELINGDRAAVIVGAEGVFVHGIPFCGSSGVNKNMTLPLRAIVSLSQAPSTSIVPISGLRAFRQLWEGCTVSNWDRQRVSACTDLVSKVIGHVPVFHLVCTPDESAVIALEQALSDLR
jgi:hypothetical protein